MKGLIAAFNYTQVNFDESEYCSNIYKHSDDTSRTPVLNPLPTLLVQGFFVLFCLNQDIKILPSSAV